MIRTFAYLFFSLLSVLIMHAQNEPLVGMEKAEILRVFGDQIKEETSSGDVFIEMAFYGHPANVFIGFKDGKVFTISVSFIESLGQHSRLALFKDVRKRIEALPGRQYSYVRIEGVDLLGESGGWVSDKRKRNAVVFGTTSHGLVYQVEIFGGADGNLAQTGEIRLTIDKEESLQPPSSKMNPTKPSQGQAKPRTSSQAKDVRS